MARKFALAADQEELFNYFSCEIIIKNTHYNVYLSTKLGEIRGEDTTTRTCNTQ